MLRINKAHPWHGIGYGDAAPDEVTVFIEIVPSDTVKYEVDKASGYLKIDRPQQYSNVVPANYGFIPQTYCGDGVAAIASSTWKRSVASGDLDPLDILVLTEHHIPRGDIILRARPIGGICLVDNGEADDKIIAVLSGDKVFGEFLELADLPAGVLARFEHYFLTYKSLPDDPNVCEIAYTYGRSDAHRVIDAAIRDYAHLARAETE